jgi:hypothetical protein
MADSPYLEFVRQSIEQQYRDTRLGSGTVGGCFGSILCHELHCGDDPIPAGRHFKELAEKWGVSLPTLGELIWDHCKRLEELPHVKHS